MRTQQKLADEINAREKPTRNSFPDDGRDDQQATIAVDPHSEDG